MTMRTHIYVVSKGNDVPEKYWGTEIPVDCAETLAEATSPQGDHPPQFENEAAVVDAAAAKRLIAVNRAVREILTKDSPTAVAEAIAVARTISMKELREPSGAASKKKGSGEIVKAKAT